MSGIYVITHQDSDTVYIGSTTRDFKMRWCKHKSDLRLGKHHNSHLQYAWNKYGEVAFEFAVLEIIEDSDCLIEREQYWLDKYRTFGQVYNTGLVARAPWLGRECSDEHRRKISEAKKGRPGKPHSEETKRKISTMLKGRARPEKVRRKISKSLKGRTYSEERCRKIGKARARPYPAFRHQETGEVIPAGFNLTSLCRQRNLNTGHMHQVKLGHERQHCGWKLLHDTMETVR